MLKHISYSPFYLPSFSSHSMFIVDNICIQIWWDKPLNGGPLAGTCHPVHTWHLRREFMIHAYAKFMETRIYRLGVHFTSFIRMWQSDLLSVHYVSNPVAVLLFAGIDCTSLDSHCFMRCVRFIFHGKGESLLIVRWWGS